MTLDIIAWLVVVTIFALILFGVIPIIGLSVAGEHYAKAYWDYMICGLLVCAGFPALVCFILGFVYLGIWAVERLFP